MPRGRGGPLNSISDWRLLPGSSTVAGGPGGGWLGFGVLTCQLTFRVRDREAWWVVPGNAGLVCRLLRNWVCFDVSLVYVLLKES